MADPVELIRDIPDLNEEHGMSVECDIFELVADSLVNDPDIETTKEKVYNCLLEAYEVGR